MRGFTLAAAMAVMAAGAARSETAQPGNVARLAMSASIADPKLCRAAIESGIRLTAVDGAQFFYAETMIYKITVTSAGVECRAFRLINE